MADLSVYTLWLWTEGAFARRVMYQLLQKNLVSSTSALLQGQTTDSKLQINPVSLDPATGWVCGNPDDPPPEGSSNPCMRAWDPQSGKYHFVYESTSIMLLLEELFPRNPMQPSCALQRAQMADMLGKINIIAMDTNYFLRNTVPEHGAVMGIKPEDQSRSAALNARTWERKGFLKLQTWAEQNGLTATAGWLTPGVDGPGLVDFALVSNHRFVELMYGINILEDDELSTLYSWYKRFKGVAWWNEFEERDGIVPSVLANARTSRAAWVTDAGENI